MKLKKIDDQSKKYLRKKNTFTMIHLCLLTFLFLLSSRYKGLACLIVNKLYFIFYFIISNFRIIILENLLNVLCGGMHFINYLETKKKNNSIA